MKLKNTTSYNFKHRQMGFGILDALLALLIFSIAIPIFGYYVVDTNKNKQIRKLAEQTELFASMYASFLTNSTFASTVSGVQSVLPTNSAIAPYWNLGVSKVNILNQEPCLIVSKNATTNDIEAIMVYQGDSTRNNDLSFASKTALLLGYNGALVKNGVIYGNSGWVISSGSPFLTSSCGSALPPYSVAVNIDMMNGWNQFIQPNTALTRTPDVKATQSQLHFPGHILNTNTAKNDVYVRDSTGNGNGSVILNQSNDTLITVTDNGSVTKSPIVSIAANGNTTTTNLTADQVGVSQLKTSGSPCDQSEIGKVAADAGSSDPNIKTILARSSLVCTQNSLLCNTLAGADQCYLPTQSNTLNFTNYSSGVQDTSGNFRCPSDVPYLVSLPGLLMSYNMTYYKDAYTMYKPSTVFNINCPSLYGACSITGFKNKQGAAIYDYNTNVNANAVAYNYGGFYINVGFNTTALNPTINYDDINCNILQSAYNVSCGSGGYEGRGEFTDTDGSVYTYLSYSYPYIYFKASYAVAVQHITPYAGVLPVNSTSCSNMPVYTAY